MLQGLQLMERAELNELGKLTRLEAKAREEMTEDQLRRHILKWAGKVVACSNTDPLHIERACLHWLARHWNVDTEGLDDTDELERALRIRIAADAAKYLAPTWWLACALIAAGPADALMPKVRLLEKAASLVVPSRSARQKLAESWRERCQDWGFDGAGKPEVLEALEVLRQHPERADQALTLCLVISLADGRLAMEEERIFKTLAEECGKPAGYVSELIRKVNTLYWGHQVAVAPKQEDAHQDKVAALQAAQMTLDSSGTLEGLCLEACDQVVSLAEHATHAPQSGWQRVLGSVSGLRQFFSNRMREDEQINLVRLVYLAIIHQHAEAAAAAEKAAQAARQAAAATGNLGPARPAASTGEVGPKLESRSIKLD